MSDSPSQENELRLLEKKRLTVGLTPREEARRAELSGRATGIPGFDVNAAAARVRASLDPVESPIARPQELPDLAAPIELDIASGVPAGELGTAPLDPLGDPALEASATGFASEPQTAWDAQPAPAETPGPVYDAAAYGLDPNDPVSAAWAAWYAQQGWDPATAYAYAQAMNAQPSQDAEQTPAEEPVGDAPLPSVLDLAPAAPDVPAWDAGALDAAAEETAPAAPTSVLDEGVEPWLRDERDAELAPAPWDAPAEAPTLAPDAAAPDGAPMETLDAASPPGADGEPAELGVDLLERLQVACNGSFGAAPEAPEATPWTGDSLGSTDTAASWVARHAVPAGEHGVDFEAFDAAPEEVEGDLVETAAEAPDDLPVSPVPEASEDAHEPVEILDEDIVELVAEPETPTLDAQPPVPAATPEEPAAQPEPAGMEQALLADAHPVEAVLVNAPPVDALSLPLPAGAEPEDATLAFRSSTAEAAPQVEPEPEPHVEPEPEPLAEPEPALPPPPASRVAGSHRVVVHTADGQVKRGLLIDAALDDDTLVLHAQTAGAPETLATDELKAVFFMLPVGEQPPTPEGQRVRVTFRDGRQVAGFSADYAPERPGFFVAPADTRTHTARIWVYRSAVRQVSVS
jgi:hypothetical protein